MRQLATAVVAGPLALLREAPAAAGLLIFVILLLTALTQIGGLVLWFCVPGLAWIRRRFSGRGRIFRNSLGLAMFVGAYLAASLAAVPVAGLFGRAPLPCGWFGTAAPVPRTILTCLLNRHYATQPAKQALGKVNNDFMGENKGLQIQYLDAGFPFFDGFPMIPHLSHRDGRKIDLALIYDGGASSPSPIGYWGYIQPRPGDPRPCDGIEGWLRWDMDWLQPLFGDAQLDEGRTRVLLLRLAAAPEVRRILIGPHLESRLALDNKKIRFQGCRAARHDDHIHVEF